MVFFSYRLRKVGMAFPFEWTRNQDQRELVIIAWECSPKIPVHGATGIALVIKKLDDNMGGGGTADRRKPAAPELDIVGKLHPTSPLAWRCLRRLRCVIRVRYRCLGRMGFRIGCRETFGRMFRRGRETRAELGRETRADC